jgi:hypothetical protein
LAPIALFVYNRPDHLTQVAKALAHNREASMSKLFIYSDAPKSAAAEEKVAAVRSVARSITGFQSVDVVEQSVNLGVARSIIHGVNKLAVQYGRVIVLEDDLLPSPYFLRYMNDALNFYEHDDQVISVHGYTYPVKEDLPETFFIRGADCWGWGTWARGWELFNADGAALLSQLQQRGLAYEFDLEDSYPYTQMLKDCIAGKNDSWAIRWYASAFLLGKLTLYPGSSLVQNIGADGSGVHVGNTRSFEHKEWGRAVEVARIPVEESPDGRLAFAKFLSGLRPPFGRRVLNRARRLISLQRLHRQKPAL